MSLGRVLSEIRTHGSDTQWWRKRLLTHVVSRYYDVVTPKSNPLVSMDWDNVILLDACRYDLFREGLERHPLPGTLDHRKSVETGTPGYLRENFGDETFHDVVYITANPYVQTELPPDTFHAVDHVWRDGWDDSLSTVLPETMLDRALAAAERYPDKRLLVHFNQPHAPFVGDVRVGHQEISAIRRTAMGEKNATRRTRTPFEMLGAGEVDRAEVWEAYLSNLLRALPAVEQILEEFDGLTAVTSDHGNALGEWASPFPVRVYGHPLGIHIPALTEVPWHVHTNGDRKQTTAAPPSASDRQVNEDTKARLRDLGYAE